MSILLVLWLNRMQTAKCFVYEGYGRMLCIDKQNIVVATDGSIEVCQLRRREVRAVSKALEVVLLLWTMSVL